MAPNTALIGMSCRFPGNIRSPEEFWDLISEERDAIGDLPDDRGWEMRELYSPERGEPGKLYIKRGYFLHDVYRFDAGFFGMGPREARATDPQQRINLELSWEALERAGIDPLSLRGTRTGVFVGAANNNYYWTTPGTAAGDLDRYWGTGGQPYMVSGRVAYALGLEGPAMTVDTGCSSALVALHLARQSLLLGECDLAIVSGITVMTHPDILTYFSGQQAIAPDGNCKPFAAGADGASFGEGAGVLVLERLPDARRSGHQVLAVIRGSALSQDGATSTGLTVPSIHAQRQVIRAALRSARLEPHDIDAVEAHGTGTIAGDPVEARALIDVYGHDRGTADPLWVGSVKSNIGHTQWAAGTAGIIKMTLAMRHEVLPKTLHVDRPAPDVGWGRGTVRLQTEHAPWPRRDRRRRAGVSSFGISGTNAHVILEEPPRPTGRRATVAAPALTPILLSAKTDAALRDQARQLVDHPSASTDEVGMADLGHALASTRSRFERRAVILAAGKQELRTRLRAFAAGEHGPGVIAGMTRQPGKTVFVFPGQSTQWPGVATALMAESPVFARQLAACDDALAPHVDWSLVQLLRDEPNQAELNRLDVIQPALFAIAVSLAALWRSLGVEPDAVVGHSQGEIAAAYTCGALSLDDAARLSALRAKAVSRLTGEGTMVAVALGEADLRELLTEADGAVTVAVVNSPRSTVVTGPRDAVDHFTERLTGLGVTTQLLPVAYASHSAQVEEIRDELEGVLTDVSARPSTVRFYSTVTGGPIDTDDLDGDYWWNNLRRPVRFADATRVLVDDGFRVFIEASPHPVLAPAIRESLDEALPETETATVTGSLHRQRGGLDQFLTEVAKAHVAGVAIDWDVCFDGHTGRHVDLPTYPFQGKVHRVTPPPRIHGGGHEERSADTGPADTREDGATANSYDGDGDLFRVNWTAVRAEHRPESAASMAIIGPDTEPLGRIWRASGHATATYPTLRSHQDAIRAGAPASDLILAAPPPTGRAPQTSPAAHAHAVADWALRTLQAFLADSALADSRLVIVTHLAVACDTGESAAGFPEATVVGLVRSAQSEYPGRIVLLDSDHSDASVRAIPKAVATCEPQLAIRDGHILVPRLVPARADGLVLPDAPTWRLTIASPDDLSSLALLPASETLRPLGPSEVRVSVRAAGVRPRHDLAALGGTVEAGSIRCDIAGVVVETGSDVMSLAEGDRVMGLTEFTAGNVAITDHRLLARIPAGCSFPEAVAMNRTHSPLIRVWDVRQPQEAFHFMRETSLPVKTVLTFPPKPHGNGTFLITGGTGSLARLVARHLITAHGVRHLLLVSRRGADAPGARDLIRELRSLGANVRVCACDVTDLDSLKSLIATIPAEHPLTGIFHAAGVLENDLVPGMTTDRLHAVLAPKVEGTWNLYQAIKDLDICVFVLFSSVAASLGLPGQGNYAAANAFLDSLASQLREKGIPAMALAWGTWATRSGLIDLTPSEDARLARNVGLLPLTPQNGVRLLDRATGSIYPSLLVAARFDRAALRSQREDGMLLPLLSPLGAERVGAPSQGQQPGLRWADDMRAALELVTAEAAVVLGYSTPQDVKIKHTFKELGIDSLGSLELSNRLSNSTGLKLPATLTYDYPTPGDVAAMLQAEGTGQPNVRARNSSVQETAARGG